MNKVSIIIPNYNMGEHTDYLVERIEATTVVPHNTIVVDVSKEYNSKYAQVSTKHNIELNHALSMGALYARNLAVRQGTTNFAYWFVLTSVIFTSDDDVLKHLYEGMQSRDRCVMMSPSFDSESNIPWNNLYKRGSGYRRTWGMDCYATLYRADWFDANPYDPRLMVGWGMDLEMSYKANVQGRELYVCDDVMMHKETGNASQLGRWSESIETRNARGAEQMHTVLDSKYGKDSVAWLGLECKRISGVQ